MSRLILRDLFGVLPDDQADVQARVERINQRLKELRDWSYKIRDIFFEIGAELLDLKEKRIFEYKWTDFCKAEFPDVGQREIEKWMQLAKNRSWLELKYKNDLRVGFDNWPPLNLMLKDIQERNRATRAVQGKPPIRHKSRSHPALKLVKSPPPVREEEATFISTKPVDSRSTSLSAESEHKAEDRLPLPEDEGEAALAHTPQSKVAAVVTPAADPDDEPDPDDHGSGDSEIKRCPMCGRPLP
jgi:hypothetical protein